MEKTKARTLRYQIFNDNLGYQDIPGQKSITAKLTTKFNTERTKSTAVGPHQAPEYVDFSGTISGVVPSSDETGFIPWRNIQELATKGKFRRLVAQSTYAWFDASVKLISDAMQIFICDKVLFSDLKITAPVDGKATYSISLKGCLIISR